MARAQKSGCLLRVGQFVIFETLTVADAVGQPWATLFVHERQQQARVEPAT